MDFSLNEVQEMLADSIDKFIDNEYDFDTRQKYAASESGYSTDVWARVRGAGLDRSALQRRGRRF